MNNEIEVVGKTLEEALSSASKKLNINTEELDYQILEHPSKGLFGFLGSKQAKIKAWKKDSPRDNAKDLERETNKPIKQTRDKSPNEIIEKTKVFLFDIFNAMDLKVELEVSSNKENYFTINITGKDLGILIGRRGATLDSLQYLVNLAINKNETEKVKIILDVEGYRKRREETLEKLALRLAEKVKARGNKIILEPMNPHERRVIHTVLQGRNDVFTYSEGEEPYRKVIISVK